MSRLKALDEFQQRHAVLAFPLAIVKKFSDDGAGNYAALIAYYAFFSIFPLLLLFVTILGFVLQGDPSAQHAVVKSALKEFPIVGPQIEAHALKGSGLALAVGIVGTILSGLGVTLAAQNAFNSVYAVPHKKRPNFLVARLRGLGMLVALGMLQIVSTVASGLVAGGFGGAALTIAGIAVSLILNLAMFFATFRLMVDSSVPTSELWPGIVAAAIGWELLQAVGGVYIGHVVRGASSTYGTFATVIGLLTWLFLGARVLVYAAEMNTVLSRRLWPRSLFEPPTEADRETLRALAKVEERTPQERVDVSFHGEQVD
jgi:membrane protein